jgi:hypothetical protein
LNYDLIAAGVDNFHPKPDQLDQPPNLMNGSNFMGRNQKKFNLKLVWSSCDTWTIFEIRLGEIYERNNISVSFILFRRG